jgi:hypothetical protein
VTSGVTTVSEMVRVTGRWGEATGS